MDWRAPLAQKYYQKSRTSFSINDYDYKLILRRALRTGKGKVLDMKNEYLNLSGYLSKEEIAGRDEALVFDPFLKEILRTRKEKQEICDSSKLSPSPKPTGLFCKALRAAEKR